MQGAPIDDDALAAAYSACVLAASGERVAIAEAARRIGCARSTLSTALNSDGIAAIHRAMSPAQLARALARYGLGGDGKQGAELTDFDAQLRDPEPITPDLVRQAALIVHEGYPAQWALVAAGADEFDAEEWLAEALEAQEQRVPGWPASGLRLLTRAAAEVSRRIFQDALSARGSDARIALGRLIAPKIFRDVGDVPPQSDPFADLSDEQLERLALADFGDPDEPA